MCSINVFTKRVWSEIFAIKPRKRSTNFFTSTASLKMNSKVHVYILLLLFMVLTTTVQSYPIKAVPYDLQMFLGSDNGLHNDLRRLDRLAEANGRSKRCRSADDCLVFSNIRELVPYA
ncbi:hypothetical protein M3Y96_00359300 [Aphelenchoides besseyi]|nr:hypothetical protein M3Y96_00359300 [Aphelenchoides besseyi]